LAAFKPRWTEDQLRKDIELLCERISRTSRSDTSSARAAVSYLNQMLKDRRAELARMRRQQAQ